MEHKQCLSFPTPALLFDIESFGLSLSRILELNVRTHKLNTIPPFEKNKKIKPSKKCAKNDWKYTYENRIIGDYERKFMN